MEDLDRTSDARITKLELRCRRNHQAAFLRGRPQLFRPECERGWKAVLEFRGNWMRLKQLSERNWENRPRDDRRDCIPDQITQDWDRRTCHDPYV